MRTLGALCLLLALAVPAAAGGERPARTGGLDRDEKVVLALLGQMGSKAPARKARALRLYARYDDAAKLKPLTAALRVEPASLRIRAAKELARIGDARAVRPLLARVLREPQPTVRAELARAAGRLRVAGSVHALGAALRSRDEVVRRRAAEALGQLGDVQGLAYLVAAWEARGGNGPRVYFAQLQQVSFIQDFDVEVAKTSFIADPVVGVINNGVALPVKILATEQSGRIAIPASTLQRASVQLAGGAKARDAKGWRRWWDANAKRLLD